MRDTDEAKRRMERNADLVHRMKTDPGDDLRLIGMRATFFPPRPIIKKDKEALEMIHKDKKEASNLLLLKRGNNQA